MTAGLQSVSISPDTGAEFNNIEAVLRIQAVQHKKESILGLVYLLAFHAAGGVEDEDHILRDDLAVVHVHIGCDQQQEEAVFASLSEAE